MVSCRARYLKKGILAHLYFAADADFSTQSSARSEVLLSAGTNSPLASRLSSHLVSTPSPSPICRRLNEASCAADDLIYYSGGVWCEESLVRGFSSLLARCHARLLPVSPPKFARSSPEQKFRASSAPPSSSKTLNDRPEQKMMLRLTCRPASLCAVNPRLLYTATHIAVSRRCRHHSVIGVRW